MKRRSWIIWLIVLAGILLLLFLRDRMEPDFNVLTQHQFAEFLDADRIGHARITFDPQSPLNEIVGTYYRTQNQATVEVPFQARIRLTGSLEEKLLQRPEFEPYQPNTVLLSVIWSVLPIIAIAILIWFFFIRQIRRTSGRVGSQQAKTTEQQDRLDKILDKWEEQLRRMDAVLNRMEDNPKK
jgi:ATP-dependent Zn protease